MASRGEIMENLAKLDNMRALIDILINIHQTALFNWKIGGADRFLSQIQMDELIERYKTLKTQLPTKYSELL